MAIEFKRNVYEGRSPEFWRGEAKILPGGFKPVQSFATGTLVRRGTPVYVDFANHTAAVCKTAKVIKGGTTKSPRVTKGTLIAVGDVITKYGDGASTPSVTAVDTTTSTEYDVLTLSAAITGLTEGDILVESEAAAEGSTATAKYTPNNVIGADKLFDGKGLPTLDVAYDAVVLIPSMVCPIPDDWTLGGGYCLKNNPTIKFIYQ